MKFLCRMHYVAGIKVQYYRNYLFLLFITVSINLPIKNHKNSADSEYISGYNNYKVIYFL